MNHKNWILVILLLKYFFVLALLRLKKHLNWKFSWYRSASKNFRNVITKFDVVDNTAMEKKAQKLEVELDFSNSRFFY